MNMKQAAARNEIVVEDTKSLSHIAPDDTAQTRARTHTQQSHTARWVPTASEQRRPS